MKPRFLKSLAHAFLATGNLQATLALWWALRSFRRRRAGRAYHTQPPQGVSRRDTFLRLPRASAVSRFVTHHPPIKSRNASIGACSRVFHFRRAR